LEKVNLFAGENRNQRGKMPGKFDRNFTDNGYLLDYKKGVNVAPYKPWVLQFKIELSEILPLIWRRILVPSDYNFWDLHVAIQDSMGWVDYHLHYFEIKGRGKHRVNRIGIPDFERNSESLPDIFPGWEIPVLNYFNDLGIKAKYLYDFGDSWWHSVQLEGYIYREKQTKYPVCVDGERACPPEDCGGEHGYYEMLKTLSGPHNDDFEEMKSWVGATWDSEKFDKDAVKFDDPYKRWKTAFLEK
jgi:Plasmid pRiA4b ORF-3-like protein